MSHSLGDYEKATELYEQSMDLFRKQGDKRRLATCLNNLAMVVCSRADLGRAAKLIEESVALLRELGARGDVSVGLCNLGLIALLQDDLGRAADLYKESLALSWDTGVNPVVQRTLEGFAWLEQREKRSGPHGCGERRRPYTKQRAFQETSTSSPRLTLAFPLCAQGWERKHGRRRGARVEQ